MGKPAARVMDMHVCPMVTPGLPPIPHVGGPILPGGPPTVLIGGMPAACVGYMCVCVGPPDTIIMGSTGVMIGGVPAARMGDPCAHGGTIVVGLPTVIIGEIATAFQIANMSAITQAILDSEAMLKRKLAELDKYDAKAKADLKTWMGDDSVATRDLMKDRIKKELALTQNLSVGNFKQIPKGDKYENAYAYVYPNDKDHNIYLGTAFGTAPATGVDSKAGTLTHEMSHFNDVGGTKDVIYGEEPAKNLAKTDPAKAQKNADSFEYFIEH